MEMRPEQKCAVPATQANILLGMALQFASFVRLEPTSQIKEVPVNAWTAVWDHILQNQEHLLACSAALGSIVFSEPYVWTLP